MFKAIRSLFVKKAAVPASQSVILQPYKDETVNLEYNKLFCDNPELFRPAGKLEGMSKKLFAREPFIEDLKIIAEENNNDTRTRLLAYRALRSRSVINVREALGVVIEVGEPEGNEAIAIYEDLNVIYINAKGRIFTAYDNGSGGMTEKLQGMLAVAQKAIAKAEKSTEPRQAPPPADDFRISFLATDGTYTGQGNLDQIEADPVAKVLVYQAGDLMVAMAKLARGPRVEVPAETPLETPTAIK